ncbi:MAG: four helix bundle protein [Gemmatimonadaceae bacterium]
MSDFKSLKVWHKAQAMALATHRVVCKIRGSGGSGRRTQAINAAFSVPTNIVESRGQPTRKEECRYLRMAINSSTELEYHLLTALELKDITRSDCEMLTEQLVEVRKMLYGLIRSRSKPNEPEQPDGVDWREEPDASPDSERVDPSDETP